MAGIFNHEKKNLQDIVTKCAICRKSLILVPVNHPFGPLSPLGENPALLFFTVSTSFDSLKQQLQESLLPAGVTNPFLKFSSQSPQQDSVARN